MVNKYIKYINKKRIIGVVLFVLLLVLFFLSLKIGDVEISYKNLFNNFIVLDIRMPRSLAAIFVGASLAVAGAVMQAILKNPLASPFTLGISHGALFGASIAIVFGMSSVGVWAFVGANIVMFIIVLLSKLRGFSSEVLILCGVALSALFGSGSMFVEYFASDVELSNIVNWSFGDLSNATYKQIYIIGSVFVVSFLYFFYKRWELNSMGIEEAQTLGINIKKLRTISLFFATILTSVSVSFFGIIGFVGLIAPHFVRLFVGDDYRFLLPISAIVGGMLLLVSDLFSRTLFSPIVVPIGILTSFLGAPLFLFLLIRLYRR